jgi:hypothetical protein
MLEDELKQSAAAEAEEAEEEAEDRAEREGFVQWWVVHAAALGSAAGGPHADLAAARVHELVSKSQALCGLLHATPAFSKLTCEQLCLFV